MPKNAEGGFHTATGQKGVRRSGEEGGRRGGGEEEEKRRTIRKEANRVTQYFIQLK